MTAAQAFQPDLYDYAYECDPVPTLNRLRAEDPVHWSRHGFWYLTRYDDVVAVLQDPVRFSSAAAGFGASNPIGKSAESGRSGEEKSLSRSLANSFNQMDPPDHTRIRGLVNAAFSKRRAEERRGRILAVIGELLGEIARKPQFDLVADFAFHLPIIVASEIIGIRRIASSSAWRSKTRRSCWRRSGPTRRGPRGSTRRNGSGAT